MKDDDLPGDEAYDDPIDGRRRKTIDQKTFRKPVKAIGLRRSVILDQDSMVSAAVESMRAAKIGSTLVIDKSGRLVGIFTERDVLNKMVLGEIDPRRTPRVGLHGSRRR
jgi:CBS domain-containing protein